MEMKSFTIVVLLSLIGVGCRTSNEDIRSIMNCLDDIKRNDFESLWKRTAVNPDQKEAHDKFIEDWNSQIKKYGKLLDYRNKYPDRGNGYHLQIEPVNGPCIFSWEFLARFENQETVITASSGASPLFRWTFTVGSSRHLKEGELANQRLHRTLPRR